MSPACIRWPVVPKQPRTIESDLVITIQKDVLLRCEDGEGVGQFGQKRTSQFSGRSLISVSKEVAVVWRSD